MKSIIPARGGSKGVPGKNIKKINGIPLLAYPIISAQKTKGITEVYVSTDDELIKEVALSYGAKVIDRPSEFAQDDSLDIDVIDFLNCLRCFLFKASSIVRSHCACWAGVIDPDCPCVYSPAKPNWATAVGTTILRKPL